MTVRQQVTIWIRHGVIWQTLHPDGKGNYIGEGFVFTPTVEVPFRVWAVKRASNGTRTD